MTESYDPKVIGLGANSGQHSERMSVNEAKTKNGSVLSEHKKRLNYIHNIILNLIENIEECVVIFDRECNYLLSSQSLGRY